MADQPPAPKPPDGTAAPSVGPGAPTETRATTPPPPVTPTLPLPAGPPVRTYSVAEMPAGAEYTKIKVLGKGAFGKVYLGKSPGGIPVAIKQILRGIDTPAGQSEWQALGAMKELSHPFLIQIHDFWLDGDQLYIVTELAEGSLDDRINACKDQGLPGVPVDELVPYFAQAAEALDYLHAQMVTHRDVKPQNLLYLRGYAKVADFGLARSHTNEASMTNVQHQCGTPLFMAPEVWRKKVHLRSDQYSLAATYVTARLGRPLFVTEFIDQLIARHLEHAPDLDPLPAAEQRVLLKALAKKPEDRYPSCKAFVDALREAVAPPPPTPPAGRRRAVVAGAITGAAAVACGLLYLLLVLLTPTPQPPDGPWVPPGWAAVADAAVVADRAGKRYHTVIERPVGGAPVAAELIPATGPNDPPTFYLMRDKVTNRVFAAAWADAEANPQSAVKRFRVKDWERNDVVPLPGKWRDGANTLEGAQLGIAGDQLDVPVVKVTAVEAALIADDLGGRLPGYEEWEKAAGDLFTDRPFDPTKWASGSDRPWPTTRPTDDESPTGVRQLLSNGLEWTRDAELGPQLNPFAAPPENPGLVYTGRSWDAKATKPVRDQLTRHRAYPWHDVVAQVGFRVAIPVPR